MFRLPSRALLKDQPPRRGVGPSTPPGGGLGVPARGLENLGAAPPARRRLTNFWLLAVQNGQKKNWANGQNRSDLGWPGEIFGSKKLLLQNWQFMGHFRGFNFWHPVRPQVGFSSNQFRGTGSNFLSNALLPSPPKAQHRCMQFQSTQIITVCTRQQLHACNGSPTASRGKQGAVRW